MYDATAIKQANPLSEIIGRDIKLTKNGREFVACCPFHGENTPSFTINDDKGFYHCFGCGEHGSVIDYIIETRAVSFLDACKILGGEVDSRPFNVEQTKKTYTDLYEGYIPISPVPVTAPKFENGKDSPSIYRPKKTDLPHADRFKVYPGKMVTEVCEFRDREARRIGYEFRIPATKDRPKIPMIVTWCKHPDGEEGWVVRKFNNPAPIYGQERLHEKGQLLIVEGATKVEACKGNVGKLIPLSMSGGTGGYKNNDLHPFKDRSVIIWPDNDPQGIKYANELAGELVAHGAQQVKILTPPENKPKGWDAKDAFKKEGWDYNKFLAWAKESVVIYNKSEVIIEAEPQDDAPKKEKRQKKSRKAQVLIESEQPFKILGHDGINYYYADIRGQKIFALTAAGHTKNNLFSLATEEYWAAHFPGERGVKYDTIASWLIDASKREGIFSPLAVKRGRGAWLDDSRKIFHLGNKILVDGKEYQPFSVKSQFIYEAEQAIILPELEPASTEDAKKLGAICEGFNWENPLSAKLLAGWCVIAGICGMLEWRPHIWITGGSNTGKTTATGVVRRMLKPFSRSFGGGGTEAGIRRSIKKDAIPVVIDEMESENKRQREKVKSILFLARQASSGEIIAMGGKNGEVEEFIARSSFCFASINSTLDSEADQSRVTQLALAPDYSGAPDYIQKKYEDLAELIEAIITPKFASSMLMRAFENIDNLLINIRTFEKAGSAVFKRPRVGKQLSPFIAGHYLCHSTGRISLENAIKWIGAHNWQDHLPDESKKDIWTLLRNILSYRFRFSDGTKTTEKTVGQLIIAISDYSSGWESYLEEIKQLGIDVIRNEDAFYIANVSPMLEKILNNTAWEKEWGKRLKELPGAKPANDGKPYYYCPAIKERGTSIPLSLIRKEIVPVAEVKVTELGDEVNFDDA